jgi:D-methionine transport system substrate-binding protein
MRKIIVILLSLFVITGALTGCGQAKGETIKVGITGSDTRVWDYIKEKAKKEGINIEVVTFNDYVQPNLALADGDIDANAFQTITYFNEFKKQRHLSLTAIGTTVLAPMGLYSKKYKEVKSIPNGSTITIPNDPTNAGRALLLLQKAGLIGLKKGFDGHGSIEAITSNPKKLNIVPVEAPQTPRSLEDAAAAVINNGIAVDAGFNPIKDPIFREDQTAMRYINIIAVQTKDKDNPKLQKLVKIYQSKDVQKQIEKIYKGAQIPTVVPISEIENL